MQLYKVVHELLEATLESTVSFQLGVVEEIGVLLERYLNFIVAYGSSSKYSVYFNLAKRVRTEAAGLKLQSVSDRQVIDGESSRSRLSGPTQCCG